MRFLVTVRIPDRAAVAPLVPMHLAYLNAETDAGHFLAFGAFADGSGGWLIAEAESLGALESILAKDPAAAVKSVTYSPEEIHVGRVGALTVG
ncbi:YciI family protein [Sutterella sp.]|uniref:YciI family protein n=1 Tax=Sutterella sp. TaxID=1981025 RepID=UPI0026DF4B87|nr:YciI family protein [Sutterella sp.]MDO5531658.1 YciI family protein [Sutterella sp.]